MNERPGIILFGNCQAGAIAFGLGKLGFLTRYYDVHYVCSFDLAQNNPMRQLDGLDMRRVVLLVEQLEMNAPTPGWLVERLEPGVPRLGMVPMDTNLLWPFHMDDPRNRPEPGFPAGRYPYGDRIVIELLRQGLAGAALREAYRAESLRCLPDLGRLAALDQARIVAREQDAPVKVADIIADQIRVRPLFSTFNHPTPWLFRAVMGRILDLLRGLLRVTVPPAWADELGEFEPLTDLQVPIHPVVARRLHLAWWAAGQIYRMPDGGMLNFNAYLRRYIDFA